MLAERVRPETRAKTECFSSLARFRFGKCNIYYGVRCDDHPVREDVLPSPCPALHRTRSLCTCALFYFSPYAAQCAWVNARTWSTIMDVQRYNCARANLRIEWVDQQHGSIRVNNNNHNNNNGNNNSNIMYDVRRISIVTKSDRTSYVDMCVWTFAINMRLWWNFGSCDVLTINEPCEKGYVTVPKGHCCCYIFPGTKDGLLCARVCERVCIFSWMNIL